MKNPHLPYDQPWRWPLREVTLIGALSLIASAVIAYGINGIVELFFFISLLGLIAVLTLRMIADILVAGLCGWIRAMGGGLGSLTAAVRCAWRNQQVDGRNR